MYIPKSKKESYEKWEALVARGRLPNVGDSHTLRRKVAILHTKGNGDWTVFDGYHIERADFDRVTEKTAFIYLLETHKPMQFKYSLGKVIILED